MAACGSSTDRSVSASGRRSAPCRRPRPLRPEITAGLAAAVAIHLHPPEAAALRRELAPDPRRQVLQGGGAEVADLVQEMMVAAVARACQGFLEQAEVDDHATLGIARAAHRRLGAIRVALNAAARFGCDDALERVGGIEA